MTMTFLLSSTRFGYVKLVLFFREKLENSQENEEAVDTYHVEFTFDSDINCAVRIFMMAKEETGNNMAE